MTRFFATAGGVYVGGFDGQTPAQLAALLPAGAVEVPAAPKDARATWDGVKWTEPAPAPDKAKALRDAIDAANGDAGTAAKMRDVLTALKDLSA